MGDLPTLPGSSDGIEVLFGRTTGGLRMSGLNVKPTQERSLQSLHVLDNYSGSMIVATSGLI
jgi:hypothetical protein